MVACFPFPTVRLKVSPNGSVITEVVEVNAITLRIYGQRNLEQVYRLHGLARPGSVSGESFLRYLSTVARRYPPTCP